MKTKRMSRVKFPFICLVLTQLMSLRRAIVLFQWLLTIRQCRDGRAFSQLRGLTSDFNWGGGGGGAEGALLLVSLYFLGNIG